MQPEDIDTLVLFKGVPIYGLLFFFQQEDLLLVISE